MLPKPDIKVGDVGLKYLNTGCGRISWTKFTVTGAKGTTITVVYDQPCNTSYSGSYNSELTETFRWRTPGKWIPVGCKTNDFKYYHLTFNQDNPSSGSEEGMF